MNINGNWMNFAYMDNPRLYGSGNAIQHLHYLPFGEDWVDQRNSSWNAPYTFSGKEKDMETGYSYFGARYYDSGLSIWLSVDPMSDKYPTMSPYNYCANNPVMIKDPNGMDLDVELLSNGVYRVVGGTANSDKNIYVVDSKGKRTGIVLGEMLTEYSFHDNNGNAYKGALIDTKSHEGANFLNKVMKENPPLIYYMFFARHNKKYDFKSKGMDKRPKHMTENQYQHRGSVLSNGKFASARDIGNIAAGYFAGLSGLGWNTARLGFDGYESIVNGEFKSEGKSTQLAQKYGYNIGYDIYCKTQLSRLPGNGHLPKN
jgi:RHS repeat-associated protein